jgi:hypothetical protein
MATAKTALFKIPDHTSHWWTAFCVSEVGHDGQVQADQADDKPRADGHHVGQQREEGTTRSRPTTRG